MPYTRGLETCANQAATALTIHRRASLRRYVTALSVLLIFILGSALFPSSAAADTPIVLTAPVSLTMSATGSAKTLSAGAWINSGRLELHFQVDAATGGVTPQVEVQPFNVALTGKPNFSGSAVSSAGEVTVAVTGLQNRLTYHWAARAVDGQGNASDWVTFADLAASSPDFGIDEDAPARPIISSSTDPEQNQWYNNKLVALGWTSHDALSGVVGYSFVLERHAHVIPPGATTAQHSATISNLADGIWFIAIRAVDGAGNWSPTATFRVELDRQLPHLIWLSPSRFTFNPFQGPTTVRFRVDKEASSELSLYRVGSVRPVSQYTFARIPAGRVVQITWSGKVHGKPVAKGYYFFSARITDHANNLSRLNIGGIVVDPQEPRRSPAGPIVYAGDGKRIIVSLSHEALYAYDGDRLVLQTVVTTGNPNLPTPVGHYAIMQKQHPFEFISPWPVGSPYWYAPSWSQYAMLFRDGGYYLHDAPWRSAFGPGTNGPGQPGTNYGGTHGCVNIPPNPMLFLWNWSAIGTTVDVVP